ncbi:hypothetical protein Bbelb_227620 [Branchiostoma belcheri]|nr:hypothetical protein Bbelb_227620 [Branchiostoma belcheri]
MGGQSALTWFRTWRAAPRHRQEQSPYVGGNLPTSLVPMRRKAPARRVLVSGRPQQFRPMGMLLKRRTSRGAGEKGRGNPQRGAPTLESHLVSRGYDRFLRPSFGGPPVEVEMSMTISSIDQISEVNMDYTITVFLRQYWKDERLAFAGSNHSLSLDGRLAEKLWVPDTFIPNAKESFLHKQYIVTSRHILAFCGIHESTLYACNSPSAAWVPSSRVTIGSVLSLTTMDYPGLEPGQSLGRHGYKTEDIRFRWKAGNNSIYGVESLQLQQFKIGSYNVINGMATYESGDYSNVKFCFLLHRQAFYFIFQTYIPSILLVVLSWVSFWINAEAVPARVALGITTVLTMTTLIGGARATMPKISYIKAIDVYLITCFLFTFAALVEYAAVNFRSSVKKMKEAKRKMATDKKCKHKLRANVTALHCVDEMENNHDKRHTILDINMADDGTVGQNASMDGQRLRRNTSKKIGVTFANGVRQIVRSVSQLKTSRQCRVGLSQSLPAEEVISGYGCQRKIGREERPRIHTARHTGSCSSIAADHGSFVVTLKSDERDKTAAFIQSFLTLITQKPDLGKNALRDVHSRWFIGLDELSHLYLGENKIQTIPSNAFELLKGLEHLDLSNNDIVCLDRKAFLNMDNLRTVKLKESLLGHIATKPPFVFIAKTSEDHVNTSLTSQCLEAWKETGGIALDLKGGSSLRVLGVETSENKQSLLFNVPTEREVDDTTCLEESVRNKYNVHEYIYEHAQQNVEIRKHTINCNIDTPDTERNSESNRQINTIFFYTNQFII